MMWFHHQPSKKTQLTCDNWTKYRNAANVSKTTLLAVLLGLGCDFLVTHAAIAQNAAQSSQAQARSARMNLAVNRQPQETYESLINRAETVAITAVKQRFSQDKHAPAVSVMIVAHSYGAIAPVLSLEISRNQWQYSKGSKTETKDQMKYFSTARMLLGFDGVATSNSNQQQTSEATPEVTPEMEQIDRFIRESDAKSEVPPEEMSDSEAPAVVPVETPTPELPTIVPGETSVPENSTLPSDSVIPSTPTAVPEGSTSPNPTSPQNNVNSIPAPTNGALPENTIPSINDIVPEDNQQI
ncbi:hypothetical protein [Gloeocapsopsis sp. IPPAS B-1203]|uniref:hypothetical protein n=1 Tax=Gloeocapsopsis sp. IPPAS B-1203 TaxID=2049454 RepID=UPI000C17D63D|nr:hypothetical protein [Gloeocapsopsis sp. IPPAS B-1203]PIG91944.1 hypothetical protein CSQ79_19065 [Gloeocapsopsis sp. IPPAS B-1203]